MEHWEAVVIENGKEVDWYDPVHPEEHKEDDKYFYIVLGNGNIYEVERTEENMIVYREYISKE